MTAKPANLDFEFSETQEALLLISKALEFSTEAIGMSDLQGRHFYHNQAFTDLFEYTVEELSAAGESIAVYVDHDVHQRVFNAIQGGKRWIGETEMVSKSGRRFPVSLRAYAVTNQKNKIIGLVGFHQDITERERTEKALSMQKVHLRQLFENSLDAIALVDEKDIVVEVNRAFEALFQFSVEEVRGKRLDHLIVPSHLLESAARLKYRPMNGETVRIETDRKCKDNSLVQVEVLGFPVILEDRFAGAYVIYRDISKRKKTEADLKQAYDELELRVKDRTAQLTKINEALRNSEEKYRLLAENVTDVIWTMDLNRRFTYVSPSVARVRGYSPEEAMAQSLEQIVAPGSLDLVMEALSEGLGPDGLAGNRTYRLELELNHKNGHTVWTELRAALLLNSTGQRIGIIGISRDISERKEAEKALKESEERLTLALQATREGVWDWDLRENRIYGSPRFYELMGLKEGEQDPSVLLEAWKASVHPDNRHRVIHELQQNMEGKSPYNVDFMIADISGQYRWRNVRGITLFDEQEKSYRMVGSVQDIQERKQAEKKVRMLTQELIEAQENERQRISRELHDRVAQDLSSSKIACDLFLDNDQASLPEIMPKISEISKLLNATILSVRDLAYDLRPPGFEELGLTETIFLFCEEFSEKSGVPVDVHFAGLDGLNLRREAEINIFRLIQEGLNNVWKHARASHAIVRLVGASPNVILRIEDDGVGFEIKKRMEAAMDEKRMGLRSMEERANLLRGKMTIQSKQEEGTIIIIKFPYEEK